MKFDDAKRILNKNGNCPYSDDEIKAIVELLESMADVACGFLTKQI